MQEGSNNPPPPSTAPLPRRATNSENAARSRRPPRSATTSPPPTSSVYTRPTNDRTKQGGRPAETVPAPVPINSEQISNWVNQVPKNVAPVPMDEIPDTESNISSDRVSQRYYANRRNA